MSSSSSSSSFAPPKKLGTRFLGNTGVLVSELCLGAMTLQVNGKGGPFGMPGTNDETVSHAMLDRFVELGGNFIDTADGWNESEQCIGNWLSSKSNKSGFRDELVIATKVRHKTGSGDNDVGLSRKHIMANVERSLKHLQTSFIDLYQVHYMDNRTDIYDVMRTLNDLVRLGKVRNIGFCNFSSWQAQKAIEYSKTMGLEPFISNSSQYSLLCRFAEWDLIPQCQDSSLAFLPWSPLCGGWLSGKFQRGATVPPTGSRVDWAEAFGTTWSFAFKTHAQKEQTYDIVEEVCKVAEEIKATPAQVALRWLLQRPGVTAPIIGAKYLEQLNENLEAGFIKLSEEQMDRLTKVSTVAAPYPWGSMVMRPR